MGTPGMGLIQHINTQYTSHTAYSFCTSTTWYCLVWPGMAYHPLYAKQCHVYCLTDIGMKEEITHEVSSDIFQI